MDVGKYSTVLRVLVNQHNAMAWYKARNKQDFCNKLLDMQQEHPIIQEIVSGTLNNLLSHRYSNPIA
ncbi:hypothetical protein [Neptuniibacter halophilus]|uniref:hypothetical protein n=1 Tax=Neptuniibacter halophilus TaxID=651666 RepID=UPI00257383FC|nr:hypothetical protein [Neptuniibacter halophilus]